MGAERPPTKEDDMSLQELASLAEGFAGVAVIAVVAVALWAVTS